MGYFNGPTTVSVSAFEVILFLSEWESSGEEMTLLIHIVDRNSAGTETKKEFLIPTTELRLCD